MKNRLFVIVIGAVFVMACIVYIATGGLFFETASPQEQEKTILINEVMSRNAGFAPDEAGEFNDWVELYNPTDEAVNLRGMALSDDPKSPKWVFPSVEIEAGGYLLVFCSGKETSGEFLHANFRLGSDETIVLTNSSGEAVDSVRLVDVGQNVSIGRGADNPDEWHNFTKPTPGYPNTEEGYEAYRRSMDATQTGVIINELMPGNRTTIADKDGDYSDWIEIRNTTDQDIDLSGFGLSDDPNKALKWRFPDGVKIPAGGYLLLFASGKTDPFDTGTELHASFRLNSYEEQVVLCNRRGQTIDSVEYREVPSDASYGRTEEGWAILGKPTPGLPNTDEGFAQFQRSHAFVPAGLMISEVMSANSSYVEADDKQFYDWIELHNPTGADVSLLGYGLSDNSGNPLKWKFPDATISAGGYMVVLASGRDVRDAKKKYFETNFALSKAGEVLILSDDKGNIIDRFNIGEVPGSMSYGRKDGKLLYFTQPTPGENNAAGWPDFAPRPEILTPPGYYGGGVSVEVSVPEGTKVCYTLDGSVPTESSSRYTEPVEVSKTGPLRAVAFKDELLPSGTVTASYVVDNPHELPIIVISTDPKNMYDPKTGIYVKGSTAPEDSPPGHKLANYMQEWERPISFELFETDGTRVFQSDAVFRIFGAYSRFERDQKGLAVIARGEYGSSTLQYPFFESRPYTEYKSIVLRASAMDSTITKVRDILATSILGEGGVMAVQAYRQCVLYINGEYFGVYNLREKVTKHFLAQHYGVNPENLDLLVGNGTGTGSILQGDTAAYKELMTYLESHRLDNADNYAYIESKIDVDSFIEFLFGEMFFMNTDSGNIKFFRERNETSKWRWIFYDLDWGYAGSSIQRDPFEYWLHEKGHGNGKSFSTLLPRRLFESKTFREKFLNRAAYLLTHNFTAEHITARMDEMTGAIESEMERDTKRWTQGGVVSLGGWRANVKATRKFCEQRTDYMIYYMQKQFGLSDSRTRELFGTLGKTPG